MAKREIPVTFVDSSAWFALYVAGDPHHAVANQWLASNRDLLITTDYIIDETLTLLRSRSQRRIAIQFGWDAFAELFADLHFIIPTDVADAWDVFHTFHDKDWSFTDCTCKVVMARLSIDTAFTFDYHFRQFGTVTVVP
jgi:uncharacterized protein